jgi:RNA polymerase sigma-70 factor (ECF subfamily)
LTTGNQQDISALLAAWSSGDRDAFDRLIACVYPELRRIARQYLRGRPPGHSLESAALANEAYLKLLRAGGIRCENRVHFLALCAQITRRILVDRARSRGSAKRGGAVLVSLSDDPVEVRATGVDAFALNEALDSLSKIDPRKSRVVELRYFGGLSVEETAEALGISPETAKRDWRMARAWLLGALRGDRDPGASRKPA